MPDPAAPKPATNDYAGLLPLSFHVTGSAHRGTQVRLVRAGPSGELAEKWMVMVGPKMLTTGGQELDAHPWPQIKATIQRQVGMPWDQALKLAKSVKVT